MIIDGKKIAEDIYKEVKDEIAKMKKRKPSLAVILVGDNPASLTYIKMKKKACEKVGIDFSLIEFKQDISEKKLLNEISRLNHDKNIDGLLVQMPLPIHISYSKVIELIDPKKDVDGFHPTNVGKMLIGEEDAILPCTPHGIKVLLEKSDIDVEGKHIVIVGRSNLVGKPLAAILMQKKKGCNATVTICHSKSNNLKEITKSADILIAAIGSANFITKDMVKNNAVVIDVGINRVSNKHLCKIEGDVDFEKVEKIASKITPVPGGVGPMTIAMLLKNVLLCNKLNNPLSL